MGGMIQCPGCGKVLHSISRHDFQACGCDYGCYVDGGEDCMGAGGKDVDDIIVLQHTHLAGNLGVMLLDDA